MFTIPLSIEYKKFYLLYKKKLFCYPITKLEKITKHPDACDTSKAQKRLSAMMVWKCYSSLFDKTIKKLLKLHFLIEAKMITDVSFYDTCLSLKY